MYLLNDVHVHVGCLIYLKLATYDCGSNVVDEGGLRGKDSENGEASNWGRHCN